MKYLFILCSLINLFCIGGCSANKEPSSDNSSNKQVFIDSINKLDSIQDIPIENTITINHHFNFDSLYQPNCPCVINKLNEELEIYSVAIKQLPYESNFTDYFHLVSLGLN